MSGSGAGPSAALTVAQRLAGAGLLTGAAPAPRISAYDPSPVEFVDLPFLTCFESQPAPYNVETQTLWFITFGKRTLRTTDQLYKVRVLHCAAARCRGVMTRLPLLTPPPSTRR
jgi:hypothetical protein